MDQGIQTFNMILIPHKGDWKNNSTVRTAEELLAPPVAIYQGIHGGKLPKSNSFLSADAKNVMVSSVKLAEINDDLVLRCVETEGLSSDATIDLTVAGEKWQGKFRPYEIKTLRLNRKSGQVKEVNLLEE